MAVAASDLTSLENLHDVVVPDSAPWWPPAPGWYLLAGLLLAAIIVQASRVLRQWRRDRFRRAAILELQQLRTAYPQATVSDAAIAGLDQLLKRVALTSWPRRDVASLSGMAWIEWLNRSVPQPVLSPQQAEELGDVVYSSAARSRISSAQLQQLFDAAENWIRQHEAPATVDAPATREAAG